MHYLGNAYFIETQEYWSQNCAEGHSSALNRHALGAQGQASRPCLLKFSCFLLCSFCWSSPLCQVHLYLFLSLIPCINNFFTWEPCFECLSHCAKCQKQKDAHKLSELGLYLGLIYTKPSLKRRNAMHVDFHKSVVSQDWGKGGVKELEKVLGLSQMIKA